MTKKVQLGPKPTSTAAAPASADKWVESRTSDEAERLCDRLAVIDHGRMVTEGAPRDLIATHIEPHVVEVFGDEAGSWARARSHLGERLEVAGETAFYYCHDTAPLIAALADEPALRYLHRAAISMP